MSADIGKGITGTRLLAVYNDGEVVEVESAWSVAQMKERIDACLTSENPWAILVVEQANGSVTVLNLSQISVLNIARHVLVDTEINVDAV